MDNFSASQHVQRGAQSENSACTQGEHEKHKGENILVCLFPLMSKGEIVGIMIQVLSLMVTHTQVSSVLMKGNPQCNRSI